MSYPLSAHMSEILALTKSGHLTEATGLIQQRLRGRANGPVSDSEAEPRDLRRRSISLPAPSDPYGPSAAKAKNDGRDLSGGRFTRHSFDNADGTLTYFVYSPASLTAQVPLVVMLHGCTQSAKDFARGTRMNALADELGFIAVYPEQSNAANMQKCWNWFRPGDQSKSSGEPAIIAGITRKVMMSHPIDASRVYVAGLSAGGAAAAILVDAFPDLYAAAGIHSGLACGSASDVASALAAMQGRGSRMHPKAEQAYVPLITFHGDRDRTVHPVNSEQIHAAWEDCSVLANLKREETMGVSNGGRKFRKTGLIDSEGHSMAESWIVEGASHAWSGGSPSGSYTDENGPDASREMLRFFLQHKVSQ